MVGDGTGGLAPNAAYFIPKGRVSRRHPAFCFAELFRILSFSDAVHAPCGDSSEALSAEDEVQNLLVRHAGIGLFAEGKDL